MKRMVLQQFLGGISSAWRYITGSGVDKVASKTVNDIIKVAPDVADKSEVIGKIVAANAKQGKNVRNAIIGLGGAAALDVATLGKEGFTGGIANSVWSDLGRIEAEQNVVGQFHGWYKFANELLKMFGIEGTFLNKWAEEGLKKSASHSSSYDKVAATAEAAIPNVLDGGNKHAATAEAIGLTAAGIMGGVAVGKRALGSFGTAAPATAVVPATAAATTAAATATAAAPGMTASAASGLKGFMSKLPVVGRYFAIAGAVGGAGVVAMTALSGDANAAEIPEAKTVGAPQAVNPVTGIPSIQQTIAPETAQTIAPVQSAAADISALGVSALAARPAAATVATAGASLGLKSVPVVASVVAVGETIYNTTGHALKGEFTKAGLSLFAGAGSTVAGLGGILTYSTLGTAWHEAVRSGGAAVFGEKNTIEHSTVVQLAKGAADLTGLTSAFNTMAPGLAPAPAPVPARAPVMAPQSRTWEFDMSGAM